MPLGGFDPNRLFDSMDRNGDGVITRDELPDRRSQDRFEDYCRRAGVTDGKLTRELFLKAFQQRMEERQRGGAAADAERYFRTFDRNGDGKLDREELQATPRLKGEWEQWDTNKDGAIDLAEFKAYLAARYAPPTAAGAPAPSPAAPPAPAEGKAEPPMKPGEAAAAYRAGKPVPGLPSWFKDLDADHDGQVALHEWKGRPLEEFYTYDLNGDGFITIEEAMRVARSLATRK
jgi:Ca2+-binding EF-hand superfamily protein